MRLSNILHLSFLIAVCNSFHLAQSQTQLLLTNDAYVDRANVLCLNTNRAQSTGRAMYGKSIPICTNTSSFNTTFVFSIQNSTTTRGEGLAFTISGRLTPPPPDSHGSWLALFDSSTNKNPNTRIVAVEFDSEKSFPEDGNSNHVGVDENQIESQVSPMLSSEGVDLHDPSVNITVWIDYWNGSLNVFVSRNNDMNKPDKPVINQQPTNLCNSAAVNGSVYVGFSAATGNSSRDVHKVYSWRFSSNGGLTEGVDFSFTTFNGNGESKSKSNSGSVVTVVLVTTFCVVFFLVCCLAAFTCRRKLGRCLFDEAELRLRGNLEQNMPCMPSEFTHSELRVATGNFSRNNLLGEGGFGKVYVGVLRADQTVIAVKRISEDSKQGEREFLAEVQIISKLSHRNLVQLRGWCCRTKELLLVYDYMPNGSLDKALYGNAGNTLDWTKRYEVVCGLASALLYLHEECEQRVVHRDIKPSNVMLDVDFNARLGDFGLARLVDRNRDARTTTVAGTFGYLAPELNVTLKSTPASDVYSFGIVVLEVACGRKPFDAASDESLVQWVGRLSREERVLEAADVRLDGKFEKEQMETLLVLGLSCSDPNVAARPSMLQAVNILKGNAPPPCVVLSKPEEELRLHLDLESSSFDLSNESFPVLTISSAPQ